MESDGGGEGWKGWELKVRGESDGGEEEGRTERRDGKEWEW